jgi:hypothetical protein
MQGFTTNDKSSFFVVVGKKTVTFGLCPPQTATATGTTTATTTTPATHFFWVVYEVMDFFIEGKIVFKIGDLDHM